MSSDGNAPIHANAQSPIRIFARPLNRRTTDLRVRPFADWRNSLTAEMLLHFTVAEGCLPKRIRSGASPILPTRRLSLMALLRPKNERPGNPSLASGGDSSLGRNGYWYTNSLSCHL